MPDAPPIAPPAFDAVSAYGIGGLAVVVAVVWTAIIARGRSLGAAVGLVGGVMLVSAGAAWSGVLARFDVVPPPMAVMIAAVFGMGLALPFTIWGRAAAGRTPLMALVGLQSFRLPLELVMHRAGTLGIMPPELSYGGYNFDIATGAGALALWLVFRARLPVPRAALWIWNAWGCLALAVIAVVAVTTSPMVRLFGDDPRHVNTWVLFFPYVWLPAVLVTVALASHVMITRKLLSGAP